MKWLQLLGGKVLPEQRARRLQKKRKRKKANTSIHT
jgi:hypothetical protein